MAGLGVHSEVGRLKTVLVHRPGKSLERLTPQNRSEYLFDDVVWVERAQREHDYFTDVLRDRGVEVLYLQQLLAETARRQRRRMPAHRRASGLVVHGGALARRGAARLAVRAGARASRRDPRRRAAHLGARGPRPRDAQPPLARRAHGHAGLLRAAAAAQHAVHARLIGVDVRGRRSCRRSSGTRGASRSPTSPRSTGTTRGSRAPSSSSGIRRRATRSGSLSRTSVTAPRSRAATSCRSATRPCSSAWASARPGAWSSTSPARSSPPARPSASSRAAWNSPARTCTSTR